MAGAVEGTSWVGTGPDKIGLSPLLFVFISPFPFLSCFPEPFHVHNTQHNLQLLSPYFILWDGEGNKCYGMGDFTTISLS